MIDLETSDSIETRDGQVMNSGIQNIKVDSFCKWKMIVLIVCICCNISFSQTINNKEADPLVGTPTNRIAYRTNISPFTDSTINISVLNIGIVGNVAHLAWETYWTDLDSKFVLQRSSNGFDFKDIAEFYPNQEKRARFSQFKIADAKLKEDAVYFYRLKQVFEYGSPKLFDFVPIKIDVAEESTTPLGYIENE